MFSLTYKGFALRLAPSIFLSHIFASFGQDKGLWEIIITKGYFAALMIGMFCCMLVSYIITETTARLNINYPWNSNTPYRLLLQTFFGVMIPFGFIFLLITFYFAVANIWIMDTYWPAHCAPYVLIALIFGTIGTEMLNSKPKQFLTELAIPSVPVEKLPTPEKNLKGGFSSDIVFMWSVDRGNNLLFNDGSTMKYHCTMSATLEKLVKEDFIYLNRQQIVKISAIHKARYVGLRRKQIQLFLNVTGYPEIIVSETVTKNNREFWKKYLAVDY
jgi:hypothetical protein